MITDAEKWNRLAYLFEHDGSLVDIHITGGSDKVWRAAWGVFMALSDEKTFKIDGQSIPFPDDPVPFMKIRYEKKLSAHFLIGPIDLVFHISLSSHLHIECDFWPENIKSSDDLALLEKILESLGEATGQEIIFTPESHLGEEMAYYDPVKRQIIWWDLIS